MKTLPFYTRYCIVYVIKFHVQVGTEGTAIFIIVKEADTLVINIT